MAGEESWPTQPSEQDRSARADDAVEARYAVRALWPRGEGLSATLVTHRDDGGGATGMARDMSQGGSGARRILLVGSSGGHLAQLLAMQPWWGDRERHWVTFDTPDARDLLAGEQVTWAYHPTTRSVPNLIRNSWLALRLMRRWRPDAVVSTGAAVAWPFFLLARVMRVVAVFVEVYDRMDSATLTGRLCRPVSTAVAVQWQEQRRQYPEAELIGPLL